MHHGAPYPISDAGLQDVLGYWGGEAAFANLKTTPLGAHLRTIGRPRMLELIIPWAAVRPFSSSGTSVIAGFGRSEGIATDPTMADVFLVKPLAPEAVLVIHTQGEAPYAALGTASPPGLGGSFATRNVA